MKIQSERKSMRSLSNEKLEALLSVSQMAKAEASRRSRIAERNERKRARMLQKKLAKAKKQAK